MKKLGLILAGMLVSLPVWAGGSIQCGSSAVSVGDTKTELLSKCGTPLTADIKTTVTENKHGTKSAIQTGEILTMDLGKGKFMALVTVENGVITQIKNGPRHE